VQAASDLYVCMLWPSNMFCGSVTFSVGQVYGLKKKSGQWPGAPFFWHVTPRHWISDIPIRQSGLILKDRNVQEEWTLTSDEVYLSCNAHVPYCRLWRARFYYIFPHYLINGTIFEIVNERKMFILIFSTTFARNISHSKRSVGDMMKNVCWSSSEIPLIRMRF